jgi:OFA family oxalate/formate antiporter-like MFS transporter
MLDIDNERASETLSVLSKKSKDGGCMTWNWPGIRTLIGSVLLMLYLGCFFLWANISIYVLSYFHEINPGVSFGFTFLVDAVLVATQLVGYNIGLYLFQNRRWNPKIIIALGSTISLVGVYGSSLTENISGYLGCYCVLNGLGCGMCYLVPLICGWEWFPDRKGMVSGVTLGGYGFGSFIFSLVSTHLVNPDGVNPSIKDPNNPTLTFYDTDVTSRVPFMIQTLVYIWAGLAFMGVLLITRKP